MKLRPLFGILVLVFSLSACFSHHYNIGEGVRVDKTEEITVKNHFLIAGLIPVQRAKVETMVGDTVNYEVYTRMSPTDMFVSTLTIGIYTPTTTTVIIPAEKYKRNTNRKVRRREDQ